MKDRTRLLRIAAALALALAASGCGSNGKAPATDAPAIGIGDAATDEEAEVDVGGDAGTGGSGAITAIDASRGDSAALPEDSYGPSAYDLARARASREGNRSARDADGSTAEANSSLSPPASATDLLQSSDGVSTGGTTPVITPPPPRP